MQVFHIVYRITVSVFLLFVALDSISYSGEISRRWWL